MELVLLALLLGTAFIWRPSAHNLRVTTADEVAPDDYAEEEDFDLGDHDNPDDARGHPTGYAPPAASPSPSDVIFAIDSEDEAHRHAGRERSRQAEGAPPGSEERRALIGSEDAE